jgi:nitrite reductase/ring-hydroxylating ferredoxin subunit
MLVMRVALFTLASFLVDLAASRHPDPQHALARTTRATVLRWVGSHRLCCAAVNEPRDPRSDPHAGAPPTARHDVAADADVAEGEILACEIDGREIGIARAGGRLHAVSLRCTHAAWLMNDTPLERSEIVCSLHGARFDVRDGCPTAGPARGPLQTFPVHVHEGRIEVEVPVRGVSTGESGARRC